MSSDYPLQQSFSGGELSPRLSTRVSTDRYRASVQYMENFFPFPQGSAYQRAGTQYVFQTHANGPARLIQFGRGRERDYVAEFGVDYIRMYNRDGIVQTLGGELLLNREFTQDTDGLRHWDVTSNATAEIDVNGETANVTVMTYDTVNLSFQVTQLEHAEVANFVAIEQTVTLEGAGPYASHTLSTEFVFTGANSKMTIQVEIGDGVTQDAYDDTLITESGHVDFIFTPLVATVTVKYTMSLAADATTFPNFAAVQGLMLRPEVPDPLILTTTYTEEELAELDTVMDLGGDATQLDRLWVVHPNHAPALLIRVSENSWTFADAAITNPPAEWVAGNFPGSIEIFSSRTWFAGTPDSRSQLWASATGNYFDLDSSSAAAGAALDLLLVTRGAIQWIKGQKAFLIGTDLAEHTVSSSVGFRALATDDIDVLEQSAEGGVPVEPIIIGNEVVFINPDRTKLFATDYLRDADGWVATDLTWAAEHITRPQMTRHTWARDPNNQIIITMQDGTIRSCIYDRKLQVIGWSRYVTQHLQPVTNLPDELIQDNYISMCATDETSGSSQWFCIQRDDNYNIETIQAAEIGAQYCDSWLQAATTLSGTDNVVIGLEHLEGYRVQVLVNGAIEADQVVTSGQITVAGKGEAVVGLQYTAKIITLPTEGGNQAGTSQVSNRAFNKVFLRLNDSAVPTVNGSLPPLRSPLTPMNTPTPLTTGDSITWQIGRDQKGQLTIEQPLPLRTEIVGIFGKERVSQV